jgi:hypothetical protein
MRFKPFIENVIDADDDFKKKRSDDFRKKIQSIADDLPNAFQKQEELEKYVDDQLVVLRAKMNDSLKRYRLELAPIAKEYQANTTIPDLIYFNNDPRDEHYDLAKQFMDKHGEVVLKAVEDYIDGMKVLKKWSDEQKWPTGQDSLSRFTKYRYDIHHALQSLLPTIKRMMPK